MPSCRGDHIPGDIVSMSDWRPNRLMEPTARWSSWENLRNERVAAQRERYCPFTRHDESGTEQGIDAGIDFGQRTERPRRLGCP